MMETIEKKETKGARVQKCFWKQCVVFLLLMIVITVLYVLAGKYITIMRDPERLAPDAFNFAFQIDEVREDETSVVLEGWAFKLDKDAAKKNMEILLYDLEEEKIVYPKSVKYTSRADVNDYFLCEYDYTDCGIEATFSTLKIDVHNKDYEILISDKVNPRVNRTGTYLSDGRIMYCSPREYNELDVEGTALEPIVQDGVLRVYRPDVGIYVYQYEGSLYWIADETYEFEMDGSTKNEYHLRTTQIEFLPKHRLDNEHYWDNLGFLFEDNELYEYDGGAYRVSMCKLPVEYSITYITTGYYHEEKWVWEQAFRPWYDFEK